MKISPLCNKFKTSKLKLENVVKPPRKPVTSNARILTDIFSLKKLVFIRKAVIKPIKK